MPRYHIVFNGRHKDAIGIMATYAEDVEAESEDAARLKLYDNYEHISVIELSHSTEPTREAV